MNEFHVIIHAVDDDEHKLSPSVTAGSGKFGCSFEDVSDAFEKLPRMFLEPDGSFVWVIEKNGSRSQLDGLLTDDGTHLLHCELKGQCCGETLDQLLTTLGWPKQAVHFQLIQEGVFLSEEEFRKRFEF